MPIPHQQYLPLTYPNPLPDIPPGGISPHPPNPLSFPPEILILLTLLHTFYITHIPLRTKLLSALLALAFSVIEPTFYMVTREDPVTGAVDIAWDAILEGRMGRDAHTTWEQGWANLVFSGPFFLVYFWGFEGLGGGAGRENVQGKGKGRKGGKKESGGLEDGIRVIWPGRWTWVQWSRAICAPLLIWGLEIVEGYTLIGMYGWNPAWIYSGRDALFSGTIKLSYWRYWLPLGFVLELVGWQILLRVANVKRK